jgi:hypothetical protein
VLQEGDAAQPSRCRVRCRYRKQRPYISSKVTEQWVNCGTVKQSRLICNVPRSFDLFSHFALTAMRIATTPRHARSGRRQHPTVGSLLRHFVPTETQRRICYFSSNERFYSSECRDECKAKRRAKQKSYPRRNLVLICAETSSGSLPDRSMLSRAMLRCVAELAE